jgi:hypothetical protein
MVKLLTFYSLLGEIYKESILLKMSNLSIENMKMICISNIKNMLSPVMELIKKHMQQLNYIQQMMSTAR